MIDMMAITVNDTLQDGHRLGGRNLAARMRNRTFTTTTGQYFINSAGARYLDMDIFGFNENLGKSAGATKFSDGRFTKNALPISIDKLIVTTL